MFEILLPCLFFVILASVRHLLSATQKPESTCVFLLDLLHGLTRFEIASYCSDYTSPIDYPRPYFTAANPEQVHILFSRMIETVVDFWCAGIERALLQRLFGVCFHFKQQRIRIQCHRVCPQHPGE